MRIWRFFPWVQDPNTGIWSEPGASVKRGGIAFSEKELRRKLDGRVAEVLDPGQPWYVRLWRRLSSG